MLQFIKNSCIFVALTKEPSTYYPKLLRELWYTTEADAATKTISFSLSCFDNPLSFDLSVFFSIIGLKPSENCVSVPPKETMKGLEIDIAEILFSNLIASLHPPIGKLERKANICYTRYMSLIMEHLLKDAYKNENMMSLKPHNTTATTFKPILENEVALTTYMSKVVALSPDPIKSLLLPSREVNVDDTADKSSSGTSMQPVTQSKAPTVRKPRKKKIPSSTQPKALQSIRESSPTTQVAETQSAEETMAIADATKCLDVFESIEEQVLDQNVQEEVKEPGLESMRDVTFDHIMDETDQKNKAA
ncbi:hypothetical protein Tco_0765918 [Tanacetum coccineum]